MNFYSLSSGINAVCAAVIAIILFNRSERKPIQLAFAFFASLISTWSAFYFMWAIAKDEHLSRLWLIALEVPVTFIHSAFLHFTLIFCGKRKTHSRLLNASYALSLVFLFIHVSGGLFFDEMRVKPPFAHCPLGTPLLSALIINQIFSVSSGLIILLITTIKSEVKFRSKYLLFLIGSSIGWLGGLTNWFHFYDGISLPAFGNPLVSLFLLNTFYLTLRHDIFELNIVVKRTVVYTILTLSISLTYAVFVVSFERLFQSYVGYSSLIGTFVAAIVIALFFVPLRSWISRLIDRKVFGKSIEELAELNQAMMYELQNTMKLSAVATLAAGMAHEIKNPLTSIRTFAEFLPLKYGDPSFRDKFSRIVVSEVDRINNIIKGLLDFSRPVPPKLSLIHIEPIMNEILSLMNSTFLASSIEVSVSPSTTSRVLADPIQLKQVLFNVLLNASQAISDHGRIFIDLIQIPEHVRINIRDTGSGMTPQQIRSIFDPFYTTKEEGTGLGMAIVHSIVQSHGGRIEVDSKLGQGTTISLFLKSAST